MRGWIRMFVYIKFIFIGIISGGIVIFGNVGNILFLSGFMFGSGFSFNSGFNF